MRADELWAQVIVPTSHLMKLSLTNICRYVLNRVASQWSRVIKLLSEAGAKHGENRNLRKVIGDRNKIFSD